MKFKKLVYGAMVASMLIASGCGSQADTTATNDKTDTAAKTDEHAGHESHQASTKEPVKINDHQVRLGNGDLQEDTTSIELLPTFLTNAKPETREAYRIAAKNVELLQSIPCYCGCGMSANHKNNAQCFIKEVKPDKTVIWDDHGTRCGTCMNIAVTSGKLLAAGKTVKEIRTIIDNQYKTGYSKPTPTPMPM